MAAKKYYRYYAQPLNDHTNEVLSSELSPRNECAEQKLWNGKVRKAWEVPEHYLIAFFQRSRQNANLKFIPYIQEGNHPLRPWIFDAAKQQLPQKERGKRQ